MNREERRKLERVIDRMTMEQKMVSQILANEIAAKKIEDHTHWIATKVDEIMFKAMRENGIGEERAKKILNMAGTLISSEENNKDEKGK